MSKQKVNYVKLEIRVSELQTQPTTVAPWEAEVLRAMYGEDVVVVGALEIERDAPTARDEFARLANKYGPKNAQTPTVAAVYGNFGPGVKALQDAIDRAYGLLDAEVPAELNEQVLSDAAALAAPALTDAQVDAVVANGDAAQALVEDAKNVEVVDGSFQRSEGAADEANAGDAADLV